MLGLELSSQVGGEMTGSSCVFRRTTVLHVAVGFCQLWLPADLPLCIGDICLELNTSMLKRVLVQIGPGMSSAKISIPVSQTALQAFTLKLQHTGLLTGREIHLFHLQLIRNTINKYR